MPIEADAPGPPRYGGGELRLDVLDDLLPRFLLIHKAYREKTSRTKRGNISPGRTLLPRRRWPGLLCGQRSAQQHAKE
jgi:hypothetical protein